LPRYVEVAEAVVAARRTVPARALALTGGAVEPWFAGTRAISVLSSRASPSGLAARVADAAEAFLVAVGPPHGGWAFVAAWPVPEACVPTVVAFAFARSNAALLARAVVGTRAVGSAGAYFSARQAKVVRNAFVAQCAGPITANAVAEATAVAAAVHALRADTMVATRRATAAGAGFAAERPPESRGAIFAGRPVPETVDGIAVAQAHGGVEIAVAVAMAVLGLAHLTRAF